MVRRHMMLFLLLAALCSSLSACGRVNRPVAPEDVDPKYPRQYPAPQPVPAPVK